MNKKNVNKLPPYDNLSSNCLPARDFVLPTRLSNLKGTKTLAQEIIDSGAKVRLYSGNGVNKLILAS